MTPVIPRSTSRKVNGYVKAVLALETVRKKPEGRYDRFVRPLGRKRDALAADVATRLRALSGGQDAEAERLLAIVAEATTKERCGLGRSSSRSEHDARGNPATIDRPA